MYTKETTIRKNGLKFVVIPSRDVDGRLDFYIVFVSEQDGYYITDKNVAPSEIDTFIDNFAGDYVA